jgi:hypothetical protein
MADGDEPSRAASSSPAELAAAAALPWLLKPGEDGSILVTVPDGVAALPLPLALRAAMPSQFQTDSSAKRACRRKGGPFTVRLSTGDDARCQSSCASGESFRVLPRLARGASSKPLTEMIEYEDPDVLVVRKPPGLVLHGDGASTLCSRLDALGAVPCHRLDAPTEGLVLCGRTPIAVAAISASFRERAVVKRYRAVVHGQPSEDEGVCTMPIAKQAAATRWKVAWRGASTECSHALSPSLCVCPALTGLAPRCRSQPGVRPARLPRPVA